MVIGHRQHRRALAFDPFFRSPALAARAMAITAGVIQEWRIPALVARQGKAAQRGGTTVQDVVTDLPLVRAQRMVFGIAGEAGRHDRLQGGISHGPPPGARSSA